MFDFGVKKSTIDVVVRRVTCSSTDEDVHRTPFANFDAALVHIGRKGQDLNYGNNRVYDQSESKRNPAEQFGLVR